MQKLKYIGCNMFPLGASLLCKKEYCPQADLLLYYFTEPLETVPVSLFFFFYALCTDSNF